MLAWLSFLDRREIQNGYHKSSTTTAASGCPSREAARVRAAECAKRYCTAPLSGCTRGTDRPTFSSTSFACEYSTWFIRRHALRRSDLPRSPPLCESHLLPYRREFMCEPPALRVRCHAWLYRVIARFDAARVIFPNARVCHLKDVHSIRKYFSFLISSLNLLLRILFPICKFCYTFRDLKDAK